MHVSKATKRPISIRHVTGYNARIGQTHPARRDPLSDNPVLAALARLEANDARLETSMARVETEQTRLREQFNTKLDDIFDRIAAVGADADTTRAHVLYGLQENLTLSQRITKLEDEMRRH
jgi:hypothetical protein